MHVTAPDRAEQNLAAASSLKQSKAVDRSTPCFHTVLADRRLSRQPCIIDETEPVLTRTKAYEAAAQLSAAISLASPRLASDDVQ